MHLRHTAVDTWLAMQGSVSPAGRFMNVVRHKDGAQVGGNAVEAAAVHYFHPLAAGLVVKLDRHLADPLHFACSALQVRPRAESISVVS